jgi:hypothetical protein
MKRKGNMPLRSKTAKKILIATGIFMITGVLSGCLHQQAKKIQPAPIIYKECVNLEQPYAASEDETDFDMVVQQIGDRIDKKPGKLLKASLHLKLAAVYMDHRNPKLNYPRALKEIDTYISMGSKNDICMYEAKNIRRVLNWMAESEKTLREQINILEEEKGILINEINQCREDVNMLQELDMRMEQRRRELR